MDSEENGEQKDAPQFVQNFFLFPSYEEIDRGNYYILNSTFRFLGQELESNEIKNEESNKGVQINISKHEKIGKQDTKKEEKQLIVKSKDKITILKKNSESESKKLNSTPNQSENNASVPKNEQINQKDINSSSSQSNNNQNAQNSQNNSPQPEKVEEDLPKKSWLDVASTKMNAETTETPKPKINIQKTQSSTSPTQNSKDKRDRKVISPSSVFVSNIPSGDYQPLESFFLKYGKVKSMDYLEKKGFAFVDFETIEESQKLLEIFSKEGIIYEGKKLRVEKRRPKRNNNHQSSRYNK